MRRLARLVAILAALPLLLPATPARTAGPSPGVDTALILSVDVSGSVDEHRFRLQMEGIAQALEDAAIQRAILGGAHGAILIMLVQWADRQSVTVPWMRVASVADARRVAAMIRNAPRRPGDFTCTAAMMHFVAAKILPSLPVSAERIVLDVSGDGADNCNADIPTARERDALVAQEVTINGLPILEGEQKDTVEDWYRRHVMGGPAAFVLPADGYKDFGRAIRQKFLTEISAR